MARICDLVSFFKYWSFLKDFFSYDNIDGGKKFFKYMRAMEKVQPSMHIVVLQYGPEPPPVQTSHWLVFFFRRYALTKNQLIVNFFFFVMVMRWNKNKHLIDSWYFVFLCKFRAKFSNPSWLDCFDRKYRSIKNNMF
jgi:hypothetical protein